MSITLQPDQTLNNGRYRILHTLGRGGFGAVYKAKDSALLDTIVAIKENLQLLPSSETQFMREAVTLARLHHSNLPRVTNQFIEQDGPFTGRQFLVMDYIEGQNLKTIAEMHHQGTDSINEEKVKEWILQVMDALNFMHSWRDPETGVIKPIIHRDIKPENILIRSDNRVFLVDFGLAKENIAGSLAHSTHAYTRGYAPPEQCLQLDNQHTDERSDIYSVGATIYHLMTGEVPIDAGMRTNGYNLKRPSVVQPKISSTMEQVITRAMAMDPAQRYATVEEMKHALVRSSTQTVTEPVPTVAVPTATNQNTIDVTQAVEELQLAGDSPVNPAPKTPTVKEHPRKSTSSTIVSNTEGYSHLTLAEQTAIRLQQKQRARKFRSRSIFIPLIFVLIGGLVVGSSLGMYQGEKQPEIETLTALLQTPLAALPFDFTRQQAQAVTEPEEQSSMTPIKAMNPDQTSINSISWSPKTAQSPIRLALGSDDGTIHVWDKSTDKFVFDAHLNQRIHTVDWSFDGKYLAAATDQTLYIWDSHAHTRVYSYSNTVSIRVIDWSPTDNILAFGSVDGVIQIWDQEKRSIHDVNAIHSGEVTALRWSSDGRKLASGSNKEVWIWDHETPVPSETEMRLFASLRRGPWMLNANAHSSTVMSLQWDPKSNVLASTSRKELRIWDGNKGRLLEGFRKGHFEQVWSVSWSPDGNMVATGAGTVYDTHVRIWKADGSLLHLLDAHSDDVHTVYWSPSGQKLASASLDNRIYVWNTINGKRLHSLSHPSTPNTVGWSSDGTLLSAGYIDGTVHVWEIK
ncbi:MAG: protein kinase [Chloroflexota bacterium]